MTSGQKQHSSQLLGLIHAKRDQTRRKNKNSCKISKRLGFMAQEALGQRSWGQTKRNHPVLAIPFRWEEAM
jgi:hypothetical protein